MRYRSLVCTAQIAMTSPSYGNYSCAGTIDSLALNPSGLVTLSSYSAGVTSAYICSIGSTYNGVTADVCKAIFAQLVAAQATGSTVSWYYSDTLTCTTHPAWEMLTGWYYGPQVGP